MLYIYSYCALCMVLTNNKIFRSNDSATSTVRPYSPTASNEYYEQINKEDEQASDVVHYHYPEGAHTTVAASDYELVVVNNSTVEENDTRPACNVLPTNANQSYVTQ